MLRTSKESEEAIKAIQNFVKECAEHFNKPILNQNSIAQLANSIKIYQERAPDGLIELSNYGWYLGYDSLPRTPIELSHNLKQGLENEVDQFLSEYYEEELDNIESRLIGRNPKRKEILKEGFANHRKNNFYSSITLLLTQADGLCYDRAKKFYFQNNHKLKRENIYKPAIQEDLEKNEKMFLREFLAPMNNPSAINETMEKIVNFPVRLNRHEIIHGTDTDYGTKINSLKTISFLNYLNDVLHDKN